MSVYDITGVPTDTICDYVGSNLSQAYDLEGNELLSGLDDLVPGRLLIWHDEFDGDSVDSEKWGHLFGYYNAHRYYMYENDLAHNAYCENSILHITNKKDSTMPLTQWTGAFIHTNNIFEFRYGLIEAKIKFPTNTNVYHSTFWTLGANYQRICNVDTTGDETKGVLASTCGEIDIAEADPNGNHHGVTTAEHWAVPSTNSHRYTRNTLLTADAANWHIYSCEWTAETIKVYLDRVLVNTWNVDNATVEGFNAFRLPHFIMFNQNPEMNGTQTVDFLETLVDWVRIYAPVGVTEYIEETAVSIPSSVTLSAGDTNLLTAEFTPANPSDMTTNWVSSNESVAICYGGKITALASGTTTVTVTTKHGKTATCVVTVS